MSKDLGLWQATDLKHVWKCVPVFVQIWRLMYLGCQTIHYFPAIANHWLSAPTKAATAKPQSSTSKDKEQDKDKDKDTDNEKDKGYSTYQYCRFFNIVQKGGEGG